jgi:hypothetical protein
MVSNMTKMVLVTYGTVPSHGFDDTGDRHEVEQISSEVGSDVVD